MSNAALSWAFKVNAGGPSNKAVLVALADCVNKDHVDSCFPHIRVLVEKTELKERTVQMALADLEKRKLISREPQYLDGTRYRRANRFKLHLDVVPEVKADGAADAPHGESNAPYGAADAPGMVQEIHPHGAADAPHIEPEYEPEVEPEKNRGRAFAPATTFYWEFDHQFWPIYPKKVDRLKASQAFMKARKRGVPLEAIMNGLERYVAAHPVNYQYWKGPAAWLNGERWNDEPSPSQSGRTSDDSMMEGLRRHAERLFGDDVVDQQAA